MGYARKLKSGYVAMYRDPLTRDKLQVPGEKFPTKELAEARADQYVIMLRRRYDGLDIETSTPRSVPTLAAYGPDAIERVMDLRPQSRKKYAEQIELMVRQYFGDISIDRLTPDVVEDYYRTLLDRGVSEGSRGQRLSALKHVVRKAIRDGLVNLPAPDAWDVKVKNKARSFRPIISQPELSALIRNMPAHLTAAVYLAHDCGMRVSEIAGLKAHRIDLTTQQIEVADVVEEDGQERIGTKYETASYHRMVPTSGRTCEALRSLSAQQHRQHLVSVDARVFWNRDKNEPATISYLEYRLKRARKAAGIMWKCDGISTSVQWHDLRRAFATRLYGDGTPLVTIQRWLGHSDVSQTVKYIQDYGTKEKERRYVDHTFGGVTTTEGADTDAAG